MRLIDADAFGNRLYHEVFEKDSEDQRWDSGCWMRYRLFEKVLREQPTVEQPERKRGKWVFYEDRAPVWDIAGEKTWARAYKCPECGFVHSVIEDFGQYAFCPNCGADMREVDVDERPD